MSEGDLKEEAPENAGEAKTDAKAPEMKTLDANTPEARAIEAKTLDPKGLENIAPEGASPDAVFQLLWKRVIEAWDDDKPHQLALSYAIEHEMLPEIAGRYRNLLKDPEKRARAQKKIDGIVIAATQMLLATKTPTREKVPFSWTASVAVLTILIVAFLAYKIIGHH